MPILENFTLVALVHTLNTPLRLGHTAISVGWALGCAVKTATAQM